jgi:flavin-dependent dehydrogenase
MSAEHNFHIVIIGAGPGGALLARECAKRGVKVTLYEKGTYEKLGHDWSDAVERSAIEAAGFPIPERRDGQWHGKYVKDDSGRGLYEPHAVDKLTVYSPDYSSAKMITFKMITLDRQNFAQLLADQAKEAGAVIHYGFSGTSLLYRETGKESLDGVEVYGVKIKNEITGEESEISADLVVESSGFSSILRTSLPLYTGMADPFKQSDFAIVHREVRRLDKKITETDIYPDHYRYGFFTGYQWTHVHSDGRIDVGAGVQNKESNPDPEDLIKECISRHPSILKERIRGGRSLCIVGLPLRSFVTNGFMILGDAAATSVPTTGCGAGSAMFAALWAIPSIESSVKKGKADISTLWGLNKAFYLDNPRGSNIAALSVLRVILQTLIHEELNFLFRKDIMDEVSLESAINGVYVKPSLSQMIKTLTRCLSRPSTLAKLSRASSEGNRMFAHYKKYPAEYDALKYAEWKMRADEIFHEAST